MAGVLTDLGERTLLDVLFNKGTSGSYNYIGLSTTAWAQDGTGGSEPTDSAYARQTITISVEGQTLRVTNSNTIEFPTATENWGTIAYWALFDTSSSTAPIMTGALDATRVCNSGDSIIISPGSILFSVNGTLTPAMKSSLNSYLYGQRAAVALMSGWTVASGAQYSDGSLTYTDGTNDQGYVIGYANRYSLSNNTATTLPRTVRTFDLCLGLLTTDSPTTSYLAGLRMSEETTNEHDKASNIYDLGFSTLEPWYTGNSQTFPASLYTATQNLLTENNAYKRQGVDFTSASTSAGVTSISNNADIIFPTATASWGTIYGWALYYIDSASNAAYTLGNHVGTSVTTTDEAEKAFAFLHPIAWGQFATSRTVGTGDVVKINAGDLVIRFD